MNDHSGPPAWIDITVPIQPDTPIFEGDPPFRIELAASMAAGAICNVSRLELGAHTGTHLDAQCHFIDGAPASESIPLDACIGPAWVVDATAVEGEHRRRRTSLASTSRRARRASSSRRRILSCGASPASNPGFIALDGGAAAALVERGVRLVANDYLSIAPFGDPVATHRTLLGAGVVILEGTDLRDVQPGPVDLLCLPIRLSGSDGVPARALVRPRPGHQDVTQAM